MSIIPTPENLALGHERAIARAISWVENQHPGSLELLEQLQGRTPIIGITGPPGAGKSSLFRMACGLEAGGGREMRCGTAVRQQQWAVVVRVSAAVLVLVLVPALVVVGV